MSTPTPAQRKIKTNIAQQVEELVHLDTLGAEGVAAIGVSDISLTRLHGQ